MRLRYIALEHNLIPLTPDETILGLLAANPQHGYQLLETFDDPVRLGSVWNLSTSQLYAVLKRLEKLNLIDGQQIQADNAPTRTVYTITPAGREQLESWLEEPHPLASIRYVRVLFLSRLYVARLLNLPISDIIDRQREVCEAERARLEAQQGAVSGFGVMANDLVVAQLDAVLGWIDRCAVEMTS